MKEDIVEINTNLPPYETGELFSSYNPNERASFLFGLLSSIYTQGPEEKKKTLEETVSEMGRMTKTYAREFCHEVLELLERGK